MEEKYCRYLLDKVQEDFDKKECLSYLDKDHKCLNTKFVSNGSCFKETLKNMFGVDVDCKLYDSVVLGEGHESEKIDTIYSSSLQSLLVFHNVMNKPIGIVLKNGDDGIKFNKVFFEQKNKVIGYPSSIDVVLVNDAEKVIVFIESKLFEIVRDSIDKERYKKHNKAFPKVIGVSYLSEDNSSIYSMFGASNIKEEFNKIGISLPDRPKKHNELKKEDAIPIEPLSENRYVYSEGIKQIIAHLIGIINFKNGFKHEGCLKELKEEKYKDYKYYYLQLYNALPGLKDNSAQDKIKEFESHVDTVFDTLTDLRLKEEGIVCLKKTYQELYKENKEYFNGLDKIISFYHLNEE